MRRGSCGFVLFVLLLGAVAVACAPSRESVTAGQIGCAPNEITIASEGSSVGWGQRSATWTAECRGRIFVCSELTTGSENAADSDVSCREELGSEKQQATAPADSSAKTAAKAAGAPTSGAGFELGATSEAAQKACEGAGNAWLRLDWSWKTGETLRLTAGKPEKSGGPAAIRLEYARPESALGADSSAL